METTLKRLPLLATSFVVERQLMNGIRLTVIERLADSVEDDHVALLSVVE